MTIQLDTTLRNTRADAITAAIGTSGYLEIWSGTVPANVAATPAGTRLGRLPLSATFAAAASGGVLTANAVTQTNADNTGTATFFRLTTSAGAAKLQGSVGTSGADCNLNTTSITSGGPIAISSIVLTEPGA